LTIRGHLRLDASTVSECARGHACMRPDPALEGFSDERWRRGSASRRTMPIPCAEPDRGICRSVPWRRGFSAGSVAQQNPVWPSAASRYASAVDLNAFTRGRSRMPGHRAAMVATFRSDAPRSPSNAGVGRSRLSTASDVTRVPTRSRDRARRCTRRRSGPGPRLDAGGSSCRRSGRRRARGGSTLRAAASTGSGT
jgi:hypothetical protein